MQKKSILFLFLSLMFGFLFVSDSFAATAVGSYDELYKILPGGLERVDYNKYIIEKAQKYVVNRQLLRKKRKIKFIKPIEYLSLNEKYFSLAFDVTIEPRKKTIFALLFEKVGSDRIAYSNNVYLSWIGSRDIQIFKSLTIDDMVKNYKNMGVPDVHSDFVRPKVEKLFSSKADIGHRHNVLEIDGILSNREIKKFEAQIAKLKKQLDMYVKAYEKRIAGLEQTINELDKSVKESQKSVETSKWQY